MPVSNILSVYKSAKYTLTRDSKQSCIIQAFDYVPDFLVGRAGDNLAVGPRKNWGLKNSELRASFSYGRYREKSRTSFAGRLHVLALLASLGASRPRNIPLIHHTRHHSPQ